MKVLFVTQYIIDPDVQVIYGTTDSDETIKVGDVLHLPSRWGDGVEVKVYQIIPADEEDFIPEEVGPDQNIEFLTRKVNVKKLKMEMSRSKGEINLTPYREIRGGALSIYDYVQPGYHVPDKVIKYLQTQTPVCMSPGIYQHPFKKGHRYHQGNVALMDPEIWDTIPHLLGPYHYGDGTYTWDRDTWKYVVKYGLTLPQEFIDHVMSEEGTKFLEEYAEENPSWKKVIKEMKEQENMLCLLPDDAGDNSLDDF